jgi:5-methyltetrahydrofolate corrinoid/iron sulfur protein methyltransferase
MLIIGERINGMFKDVGDAITTGRTEYVKELAKSQEEAGANALDISVGPIKGDAAAYMKWLVETVSSVTSLPLCIDSPHAEVIEAGIKAATGKTMINSIKNVPAHVKKLIPLAKDHGSEIICLLMNEKGIPTDSSGKLEIAVELLTAALEGGIDPSALYFDPILLPVANAQKDVAQTFEVMDQLRMLTSPPPHIIIGLSNLSQKANYRSLLNRTYCVMAMSHGLDAAILDPLDDKLMNSIRTSKILLNQDLYASSYLKLI